MKRYFPLAMQVMVAFFAIYLAYATYELMHSIHSARNDLTNAKQVHDDHAKHLSNLQREREKITAARRLAFQSQRDLDQLVRAFDSKKLHEIASEAIEPINSEKIIALAAAIPEPNIKYWIKAPDNNHLLYIRVERIDQTNARPKASELTKEVYLELQSDQMHELAINISSNADDDNRPSTALEVIWNQEKLVEELASNWRVTGYSRSEPQSGTFDAGVLTRNGDAATFHQNSNRAHKHWLPLFSNRVQLRGPDNERAEYVFTAQIATTGKLLVTMDDLRYFSDKLALSYLEDEGLYEVRFAKQGEVSEMRAPNQD